MAFGRFRLSFWTYMSKFTTRRFSTASARIAVNGRLCPAWEIVMLRIFGEKNLMAMQRFASRPVLEFLSDELSYCMQVLEVFDMDRDLVTRRSNKPRHSMVSNLWWLEQPRCVGHA